MKEQPQLIPSLTRAEEACGSRTVLADQLGVSYSTVAMWHHRGSIPREHLLNIEEASKRKVTVYELLADMQAAELAQKHPDMVPPQPQIERAA